MTDKDLRSLDRLRLRQVPKTWRGSSREQFFHWRNYGLVLTLRLLVLLFKKTFHVAVTIFWNNFIWTINQMVDSFGSSKNTTTTEPYISYCGNLVHPIGIKLHQASISSKNKNVQPGWEEMWRWHHFQCKNNQHTASQRLKSCGLPDFSHEIHYLIRLFITATQINKDTQL